jgi:hypothetical protein
MEKNIAATIEPAVHPLQKSHTLISTKHVDYNNLTAFEAVSMTMALVLAVIIGALQSTMLV